MTRTTSHISSTAGPAAQALLAALADRWWMLLLRGLAAVAFGVLALVWPGITLLALTILFGAYVILDGVLSLGAAITGRGGVGPRWWLAVVGVAGVLAGLLAFLWPAMTAVVLLVFIAAWAIVIGIMQIIGAIRLRREIEGEWMLILGGVLSVAFGALLIARPAVGAVALAWMIGLFAIAVGIIYIALALRLRGRRQAL
jgi:uncharacterized membrane protein HdeD (DUF308 family)